MYNFVKTLLLLFYKIFYKVTVINGEKIENAKGVVISGNHLSNHDPLLFPAFFDKTKLCGKPHNLVRTFT